MADLLISSLRGGMNDTDPPSALPPDQCVEAVNVEFNRSMLGERRHGATAVTLSSDLTALDVITHLHRHLPSDDEADAELWAVGATAAFTGAKIARKSPFGWDTLVITDNPSDGVSLFRVASQSLHGKVFLAYKSAQDRLHVMNSAANDGVVVRVGIAQPDPPTAANFGTPGTVYAGTRYVRVRGLYIVTGSTVLVRSEPSTSVTFTPSGTGTAMRVTKPTFSSDEKITHWEIELSLDNVNFYRSGSPSTVAVTTIDDTTPYATGYAAGTLSEDIGDYTVPHNPKYLAADEDRLVMGGSWEQPDLSSRVFWTPVYGEPGVGNDERVPLDTDNFLDLDTYEGGELTGLSDSISGAIYAFKLSHVYKLIRTGDRARAYDVVLLSKSRGALPGSIVEGVDQNGHPCVYFLDPSVGPCLVGVNGLQTCGADIQTTWLTVNLSAATVLCCGLYYPDARQVHWWVSVDDGDTPTLRLVLQTNLQRNTEEGVRRGWSLATGIAAQAFACCLFASNVEGGAFGTPVYRNRILRPFIGQGDGIGALTAAAVRRLDETVNTDAGTAYYARVVTKPYAVAGLLNKFGLMAGALLATAASGVTAYIKAIRDYGLEALTKSVSLTAVGSETHVIRPLDSLSFSDLKTIQFQLGDDPAEVVTPAGAWELHELDLKLRKEETA